MRTWVYPIVEGHGEVKAAGILIRRIAQELLDRPDVVVLQPHRVPRTRMLTGNELEKAVRLGGHKIRASGEPGAIVILLDADDDCPAMMAPDLLQRVRRQALDIPVSIVMAKSEYEAWFLAAAHSLRGRHRVRPDASPPQDAESIRDAKGYLRQRLMEAGSAYSPTVDQPALTAAFDLDQARICPSFDKLVRAIERLLADGPVH